MSGLIKRCIGLIRDWWQIDRVRISPREGCLLRLQVGDVLQLAGLTVTVTARHIPADAAGVRYQCTGEDGWGELWVMLNADRQADEVAWIWGGRVQRLASTSVDVYQRSWSDKPQRL